MRLLCNYSPAILDLVRDRQLHVDGFKLSREETFEEDLDAIGDLGPSFLHWNHAPGDPIDWERFGPWLRAVRQPAVNLHVTLGNDAPPDAWFETTYAAICDLKADVARQLGDGVTVIIENMPYRGEGGPRQLLSQPSTVRELCSRADVDLLLDVAHARVAAAGLGIPVHRYLEALPLDRAWELHVNGPRVVNGVLTDRHEELTDVDYELISWLVQRSHPAQVTLEYGGTGKPYAHQTDPDALRRQISRLQRILAEAA